MHTGSSPPSGTPIRTPRDAVLQLRHSRSLGKHMRFSQIFSNARSMTSRARRVWSGWLLGQDRDSEEWDLDSVWGMLRTCSRASLEEGTPSQTFSALRSMRQETLLGLAAQLCQSLMNLLEAVVVVTCNSSKVAFSQVGQRLQSIPIPRSRTESGPQEQSEPLPRLTVKARLKWSRRRMMAVATGQVILSCWKTARK